MLRILPFLTGLLLVVAACSSSGGGSCSSSSDCTGGEVCGFPVAQGCGATGQCVSAPGFACDSGFVACGCDGQTAFVTECGFPNGYASQPFEQMGTCPGDVGDGGPGEGGGEAGRDASGQ